MAFVREWPRPAVDGYWPRAAPRAASACQPERPGGSAGCARQPSEPAAFDMTVRLVRLKTRADFLRVAATRARAARPGLIVQAAAQPEAGEAPHPPRVGYTAS